METIISRKDRRPLKGLSPGTYCSLEEKKLHPLKMPVNSNYRPARLWEKLQAPLSDTVQPARFPRAILRYRNGPWSERLGLDSLTSEEWLHYFSTFGALPDNLPAPQALRYHGHQFRHYNPQIGDGRGFLWAQLKDTINHKILDLGTKGSGRTPYSRSGDGRLTLIGAVREVLATEMLDALGVHTSKTMSVIETGEDLERGDEPSPTRSAVLVRCCESHLRIGTFQRLAYFKETENLRELTDYVLENYFENRKDPIVSPGIQLHGACAWAVARTGAQWMIHGFVHGVLNTDNINITGESFDFGPYRFLPTYDPEFTAAYFDHQGLYAYGRQPMALMWNLKQLEAALENAYPGDYTENYKAFQKTFEEALLETFFQKLGLERSQDTGNLEKESPSRTLFFETMAYLKASQVDYASFFFDWHGGSELARERHKQRDPGHRPQIPESLRKALSCFSPKDPDISSSSYFHQERPETLLIDEITGIADDILQNDHWGAFEAKVKRLRALKKMTL